MDGGFFCRGVMVSFPRTRPSYQAKKLDHGFSAVHPIGLGSSLGPVHCLQRGISSQLHFKTAAIPQVGQSPSRARRGTSTLYFLDKETQIQSSSITRPKQRGNSAKQSFYLGHLHGQNWWLGCLC